MKEKVYIETSVVGYFASKLSKDVIIAGRQKITRAKWTQIARAFDVYISALVVQESRQGDIEASQKRLDAISGLPVLSITADAEKLASTLILEGAVPEKHPEDALHISIATTNGIDYLLTWNFSHINNAQIKSKIASVIERHGYHCPIICSPEELLGE
jgi:predicted nucleic acid-binding protein